MAGAIQAGNSPYDVIDFEDEIASTFSRAGWMLGLDDLLAPDFWDDFPPAMVEMAEVWDKYNGETFRIHHNYEAQLLVLPQGHLRREGADGAHDLGRGASARVRVFTDEASGRLGLRRRSGQGRVPQRLRRLDHPPGRRRSLPGRRRRTAKGCSTSTT